MKAMEEMQVSQQTNGANSTDPANKRIRVLLVDDHEVLRQGLCMILGQEDDFEVVGEAGNGKAALTLALELQPDIVLLDIFLGKANGLDIAKQLQRSCPKTHIVMFTGFDEEELLFDAIRIGVHGYLLKTMPVDDLLSALRAVQQGERVIGDPHAVTQVLNEFNRLTKAQNRLRSGLNTLEIEIVRLAAEGCSNKEIASRKFWSEITVKRKMQDIYRKLQVTDRAQAVAEVMRKGLI
jgi:DNA-binding NarL/FixJ family response regulator